MNAHLEWQAGVIKIATELTIERPDGLEFWGVEQCFRHPDQVFIGINFNAGRANLATVAQQAQVKLDEDRFTGQIRARFLDIQDW